MPQETFEQLPSSLQVLVRHRADDHVDDIADAKWFVAAASQLKQRRAYNSHVRVEPQL